MITKWVRKIAVKWEVPDNMRIHLIVHLRHTTPYTLKQEEISQPTARRKDPIPLPDGAEHVFEDIMKHRKRGKGYQSHKLVKGKRNQGSTLWPTRNLVYWDVTLTKTIHK